MNNTTEHINSKLIAMAHRYTIPKALLKVHYLNEITKINHFYLQNYYIYYYYSIEYTMEQKDIAQLGQWNRY